MTIEGNWLRGSLTKDYPNLKTKMATLGKGGDAKAMLADLQKNGTAAIAAR
jgi:multiple sugar transport system substrate-binding protein